MTPKLNQEKFGPWAVVTGSSSGIGRAIARHLASSGVNVVLVARREDRLAAVGEEIAREFGVDYRVVKADLTEPSFFERIERATRDLDVGTLVGNAGFASPGELLSIEREELLRGVRIKVDANLTLVHHFGRRLVARGRGGILLVSSIGGLAGVPYVANTAGVEAYVLNLGEGLHVELERRGVHVTVLMPGPTLTESMAKMGVDPADMPMKPMTAERCAAEGLAALSRNRATHIAGRMNRVAARLMPRAVATRMMGEMIGKTFARKALGAGESGREL
ncbi:MAG TPA: SDR family NAD(P)-dependent oxidoreductase [Polyangiaceae bacterium]